MWETVAIIVLLGGLEFALWAIQRRHDRQSEIEDRTMQAKQLEVLDGILTELVIKNSMEDTPEATPTAGEFDAKL